MSPFDLAFAALVLLLAVASGTIVHELLHAGVLRAAGIPFEIHWLPGGSGGLAGPLGALASVRLGAIPPDVPAWQLRVASLAPFALAIPLLAVPTSLVPDPFAVQAPALQAAVVGWMACALPSPADFSMVWHAPEVVAAGGHGEPLEPGA